MEPTVFFDHYRLAKEYDGAPVEIARLGAATTYKASDLRSGAPVALTLLPAGSIDAEQREKFEEQARAALLLDHTNIVRTVEFGRAGDDFAFVSEYPHGETLAAWVAENGPMPPDAVLRVGLQIVSALGAASFHGIVHRAIEPSNIQIMSGQTIEGGWPSVKLMNFPVAGQMRGGAENGAAEFASPEQLRDGTVDFRSEMYSLGATICFLLTGAFYSAEPRSLQTRRFAGSLRKLITPMLRQNPEERPQDPTRMTEELHSCLQRVERRQALSQRFGIPFVPVSARRMPKRRINAQPQSILAAAIARPPEPVTDIEAVARPRRVWLRRGLAMAAVLLAAATVAAMLLPAPVSMILRGNRDSATIGVPVGVAQNSPAQAAPKNPAAPTEGDEGVVYNAPHAAMAVQTDASESSQPQQVASNTKPVSPSEEATDNASSNPPVLTAATVPKPATSPVSEGTANDSAAQPAPPREGPQTVWERAAGSGAHPRIAQQNEAATDTNTGTGEAAEQGIDQPNDSKPAKTLESHAPLNSPGSRTRTANATAKARGPLSERARPSQNYSANAPRSTHPVIRGSVRARFAGMTPDGSLILRFPNGETAIVPPPPGEYIPSQLRMRRPRRVIIERRTTVAPLQPFLPFIPPDA